LCRQEGFQFLVFLASEVGVLLSRVIYAEFAVAPEATTWATHGDVVARVAPVAFLILVAFTVGG
jgi:hypothetical protein